MSLQVWLPLTKDLRQQGISDLTFSLISTNTAIDNSGKLGKCYFNNSLGAGGLLSNKTIELGQKQSMFCWFKFVDLTSSSSLGGGLVSQHRYPANQGMGITIKYVSSTTGYLSVDTGTGSSRTYNTYCGSTLLQANTWYHGGYTYDNGTLKIYVNGNCEYTGSIGTMFVPADYITVFCWSMGSSTGNSVYGGYKLHGSLNDVRVYDHCLSPMEVKQISQGLILHYPLNRNGWGQPNFYSGNGISSLSNTTSVTNNGYESQFVLSNSGGVRASNLGFNGLTGPWTASFDIKSSVNTTIGIDICDKGYNIATYGTSLIANQWTHKSFIVTTATNQYNVSGNYNGFIDFNCGAAGTYNIKNLKVEEGIIETPWCPSLNHALATTMGLNSTTEYDCSGFCNNGEKIGALTYTSNTPKYAVSTHIGATSQKIHISNFSVNGFGNSYSFAWWGKRTSNSPMFWGFSDGCRLNGMYIGIYWNTGDGSSNPIYTPGTTTTITAPSVNVWHHYVMTGDGTTCKLYVDGVLYGQAKTYKAISGTSIYINGWDSSTSYCSDNTDMSDFRIYATALSADDVKSLYQNCATIDPDGTIRGQIRS